MCIVTTPFHYLHGPIIFAEIVSKSELHNILLFAEAVFLALLKYDQQHALRDLVTGIEISVKRLSKEPDVVDLRKNLGN